MEILLTPYIFVKIEREFSMALVGKIVDFGVADILQLISQQQKTGFLLVERGKETAEITFWNGMILSARPVSEIEDDLLGRKLVKSALISEAQLKRALEIQEEKFNHLGEILVDLEVLSKEMLNQIIHVQIYDTFSELFQWKEGSYAFHPKAVDFNEKIYTPVALEHILLDVLRMIDEWPNVRKSVPSMDMIFKKPDRILEGEEDSVLQEGISKEEVKIYNLLDGENTVQDIADKSLMGKFNTSNYLMTLLSNGYIEVAIKERHVTVDGKISKYIAGERVLIMGGYAIWAILIIVLMFLSPPDMESTFSLYFDNPESHADARIYIDYNRLLKIKNALQIYFWEKGEYPDDLKELVSAKILFDKETRNGKGGNYYYRSEGGSYFLH
ncbi:MAG: DUF4388 domain-containing protein [Deltaproteobacteria bacterium]|jgi:hypothetical protein|nr:DUF4388 domain-containing protein [Deltaproteobacteria bacterium]MCK5187846.1 DUF4388 domain-containing protein [Deltaproteobacteria bacterium]MCK5513310.1 DUF4388 domain-containing protein [Deltaproteobacteria bacterium]